MTLTAEIVVYTTYCIANTQQLLAYTVTYDLEQRAIMQRAWLCGITVLGPWVQIHGNGTNKIGGDVSIGHHATTTTIRDTHILFFRGALQYTLVDAQLRIVRPSWLDHSKLQHMTVQHASYAKKLWPTLVGCIAQGTTTKGTLYTAKPTELTSISTTKENPGESTPSTKGV